jgi:hypothetical protein
MILEDENSKSSSSMNPASFLIILELEIRVFGTFEESESTIKYLFIFYGS